ncbi:MAG TPA: FlgD immunoglobulin-like domain containing protein [Candidatus Saccharimonadales bacterium]|nr:FlgD immunoglobulin-like domain containing protein [Candidatus Saccharimonadales bacterium]
MTFTADSSGTWYAGVESESYYDFGYYDLSVSRCIPTPSQAYLPDTNSNSYARPVTLAWGSDGCFYGLSRGAASKDSASGYFLRVDAAGRSTILARYPLLRGSPAELVTGEDGAFYGVSSSVSRKGSPYSPACLFRVDRGGTLKFLQCFAPNLQMPGSGVPIAPGPGGGAFIALQRSPDSLGTVGAALVLYQVDSLGQMTLLHEFGGNDLSLTSRVVPDGSGGVHLALHSTGGEINGVYHVLPSGDAEKVLGLAPYPLAHAYYTCVLSAPGGVLFVVFESPTWTRCFEVWPNGHSRQLWEVPMAQLSGLDPHGLVASDGRLYLTGEVTRSDIFSTTTAATVVADTMGDVAQIASIDANLGFPVVLVELPDHTLYGIDRGARVFQLRGLVGNPVGWVTRFAAEPGHASVMLRWTPVVFGTLSYQVERAAGGGEFTPLSNLQQSGMAEITFRDSTAVPGTSYRYRVGCRLGPAGGWNYSTVATTAPQARAFLLALPAPNPSRVTTRLSFEVPSRGRVRVEVFNVAGARVRTLLDAVLAPGPGSVTWDGNDARGQLVPSGLYFVRLSTAGQTAARKVLRLR